MRYLAINLHGIDHAKEVVERLIAAGYCFSYEYGDYQFTRLTNVDPIFESFEKLRRRYVFPFQQCAIILGWNTCNMEWSFYHENLTNTIPSKYYNLITIDEFFQNYTEFETFGYKVHRAELLKKWQAQVRA